VRAVSVQISSTYVAGDSERGERAASVNASSSTQRARLTREGVLLGNELVPLLSGSAHYFRLEPDSWRPCLEAMRELGCTLVDVYVPWSVHELPSGELDFGQHNPALDIARFLRIAEEVGLYALVRPGPHINAELSGFGLPQRVLWDRECQARSAAGEAVILPMPPLAFPVPSYASRKFLHEACEWLRRVAGVLGPLTWPDGPVVLAQVDNEGALYFRDGVYEQDYHPDSIALYQRYLQQLYGSRAGSPRPTLSRRIASIFLRPSASTPRTVTAFCGTWIGRSIKSNCSPTRSEFFAPRCRAPASSAYRRATTCRWASPRRRSIRRAWVRSSSVWAWTTTTSPPTARRT